MKHENVSNEQLLIDIKNTEIELEAVQKISDGFRILSNLPENIESGECINLNIKANYYKQYEIDCAFFLKRLHELKAERGL